MYVHVYRMYPPSVARTLVGNHPRESRPHGYLHTYVGTDMDQAEQSAVEPALMSRDRCRYSPQAGVSDADSAEYGVHTRNLFLFFW